MKDVILSIVTSLAFLMIWIEAAAEFVNLGTGIMVIRIGAIIATLIIIAYIIATAKADVKEASEKNHEIYQQRKLQKEQQFLADYAQFVISKHK